MIGIIGCGIAGSLVLLELMHQNVSTDEICAIDPYFDGGSLGRLWGSIQSNTTWEQIVNALSKYNSCESVLKELSEKYNPEQTVLLSDLSYCLRKSIKDCLQKIQIISDIVLYIEQIQTEKGIVWNVKFRSGKDKQFNKLILCQGGDCKILDFGKPILPLAVALDQQKLEKTVRKDEKICLFGTAHSGTLILKNLLELNIKCYAFYKTKEPFLFARDGHYDGIKQESAEIADMILQKKENMIELIPFDDTSRLVKSLAKTDWIICATGFEAVRIEIRDIQGKLVPWADYSADTGKIFENLYGFGLAYPGVTRKEDGVTYKDVSIPSFVDQIQRCLPGIKNQE